MRPLHLRSTRRGGQLLPIVSLGLLALLLAPYGAVFLASGATTADSTTTSCSSGAAMTVTWNGIDTGTAPNANSAISWSFTNVATVVFNWSGAGAPGVSQAFLVVLFLGFPAYTKQQVQSAAMGAGTISMTYDLTQFKWYLQGLYQLHAYLETPGGSSVCSETFYVRVAQPYDVVVATIGLLLLTIAELYMIATVGPRAADKTRKAQAAAPPSKEEETPTEADAPATPPGGGTS